MPASESGRHRQAMAAARSAHLALVLLAHLAHLAAAAAVNPPDLSLATLPVAYYGANWNRTQHNIDVLARFQMVVLMQEDGHCWATCCPDRMDSGPQCGPLHDATTIKGCDSSCAQHAAQSEIFSQMKASAAKQGRRPGHAILYMNSVYLWPFDAASAQGKAVQLLDTQGEPHMESCDPGIYPSYFWDFGRKAGQDAWLDIIRQHIVNGPADGVYDDCDGTIPIRCDSETNDTCIAKRNGHMKSVNEAVTREQLEAYVRGKNETMLQASKLVGVNGSFYNKNAKATVQPSFGGGNLQFVGGRNQGVGALIEEVTAALKIYKYLIVGGANDFSNPCALSPRRTFFCALCPRHPSFFRTTHTRVAKDPQTVPEIDFRWSGLPALLAWQEARELRSRPEHLGRSQPAELRAGPGGDVFASR